jgi:hypothetical protein
MSKVFRFSVLLAFTLAPALGCGGRDRGMSPVGTLVAVGGGPVSYRSPKDGTIYVYDDKIERLVYSGPIREGQVFSVDPKNGRLMLDGRVIQDNALRSGDRHRIYLRENEPVGTSTTIDRDRDRVIVEQGTRSTEYRKVK